MWWLVFIGGIVIQVALARYTAADAYSRGENGLNWFVVVSTLGIIGVLFYLLSRPDRRLPEDEQPQNKVDPILAKVGLYGVVSVVGVLIAGAAYGPLVESLYPTPNFDQCGGSIRIIDASEASGVDVSLDDPCVMSSSERQQILQNRQTLSWTLFFAGIIVPSFGTYLIRRYDPLNWFNG
jgi:hypothetical protein